MPSALGCFILARKGEGAEEKHSSRQKGGSLKRHYYPRGLLPWLLYSNQTQDVWWHGVTTCMYWPLHVSVWWCDNTWQPAVPISAKTTTTLSYEPAGSGHSECDSKLKRSCIELRKVICQVEVPFVVPRIIRMTSAVKESPYLQFIYIPACTTRLVYVCFSCL